MLTYPHEPCLQGLVEPAVSGVAVTATTMEDLCSHGAVLIMAMRHGSIQADCKDALLDFFNGFAVQPVCQESRDVKS